MGFQSTMSYMWCNKRNAGHVSWGHCVFSVLAVLHMKQSHSLYKCILFTGDYITLNVIEQKSSSSALLIDPHPTPLSQPSMPLRFIPSPLSISLFSPSTLSIVFYSAWLSNIILLGIVIPWYSILSVIQVYFLRPTVHCEWVQQCVRVSDITQSTFHYPC